MSAPRCERCGFDTAGVDDAPGNLRRSRYHDDLICRECQDGDGPVGLDCGRCGAYVGSTSSLHIGGRRHCSSCFDALTLAR
jgi:hypothetical protein